MNFEASAQVGDFSTYLQHRESIWTRLKSWNKLAKASLPKPPRCCIFNAYICLRSQPFTRNIQDVTSSAHNLSLRYTRVVYEQVHLRLLNARSILLFMLLLERDCTRFRKTFNFVRETIQVTASVSLFWTLCVSNIYIYMVLLIHRHVIGTFIPHSLRYTRVIPKVLHLHEGKHYAMKIIIDQKGFSPARKKKIEHEIKLLRKLCHPNIVRCVHSDSKNWGNGANYLCIIHPDVFCIQSNILSNYLRRDNSIS